MLGLLRQVHPAAGQRGGELRALHPDGRDRQWHRRLPSLHGPHRYLRRDLSPGTDTKSPMCFSYIVYVYII